MINDDCENIRIARTAGLVRGQMTFPDKPDVDATIQFEIWEEDAHPYRAVSCQLSRGIGDLMIAFETGLGKDDNTYATIRFDSDGALRFVLFRNDKQAASMTIHADIPIED